MGLPITISYTFATATSSIPLSNLDANFSTLSTAVNSLGNGAYSFSALTVSGDGTFTGTGQVSLPAGTTAQRSSTPVNGMIRYNSDNNKVEAYQGGTWLNFFTATGSSLSVSSGGTGATTLTANNLVVGNGTGSVTFVAPGANGNVVQSNGTTFSSVAKIVSGTVANSTSGTFVDFSSIPSWVKRITVMLSGVSLNATGDVIIQLGYSTTSLQLTGYTGTYDNYGSTPSPSAISQAGFPIASGQTAAYAIYGSLTLNLLGSNLWTISSTLSPNPGRNAICYGTVTVAGTLDRIRVTTVAGTASFDAGVINVLWE